MGAIASQITSLTIVYSTVYSDSDQRKHQSSVLLAFVRGIHRRPVNSPHKWPVTRKMFPFDDVIMRWIYWSVMQKAVSCCDVNMYCWYRDQSRLAPSQWETLLHGNYISHWLGPYLDWHLDKYSFHLYEDMKMSRNTWLSILATYLSLKHKPCIYFHKHSAGFSIEY